MDSPASPLPHDRASSKNTVRFVRWGLLEPEPIDLVSLAGQLAPGISSLSNAGITNAGHQALIAFP